MLGMTEVSNTSKRNVAAEVLLGFSSEQINRFMTNLKYLEEAWALSELN